jgi:hypothetical protein
MPPPADQQDRVLDGLADGDLLAALGIAGRVAL